MSNHDQPPRDDARLRLPKIYKLAITETDVNVIQNSLRKMIDAEKIVLQDKGITNKNRAMRHSNIDALTAVRDRIGFAVDQIDAAEKHRSGE